MPEPTPAELHDTTRRPGTRHHTARARAQQTNQHLRAASRRRKYKARKRRHHLKTHYDPIAYGGQHIPVSPILSLTLRHVDKLHIVSFTAISGDRRAGVAERFGHSSQLYLWLHQHDPGFNPANPPGTSTPEYRNGGTSKLSPGYVGGPAYPKVSTGKLLAPHELGIDLASNEEATNFCHAVERVGLHFFQPYPTGSELHHVNCRMTVDALVGWLVNRNVIR
jgi:hypothetical protein